MTRHRSPLNWAWCVLALAGCGAQTTPADSAAAAPAAPPAAKQPLALFNGKDLTGFVQILDSKWVVENGVLLARQDPNGRREGESWLFTEKDYTDFILTLKFKVSPGGNSGEGEGQVRLGDVHWIADVAGSSSAGTGDWVGIGQARARYAAAIWRRGAVGHARYFQRTARFQRVGRTRSTA